MDRAGLRLRVAGARARARSLAAGARGPRQGPVGARDVGAGCRAAPVAGRARRPANQLQPDGRAAAEDPAGLQAFATAVSTPGSPQFRPLPDGVAVRARFGASPAHDRRRPSSALRAQGLTVGDRGQRQRPDDPGHRHGVPRSSRRSRCRVAQVKLPSGRIAYANAQAPALPAPASPPTSRAWSGLDNVTPSSSRRAGNADPGAAGTRRRLAARRLQRRVADRRAAAVRGGDGSQANRRSHRRRDRDAPTSSRALYGGG